MEVVCCFPQSHSRKRPRNQNYHSSVDFDSAVDPPHERICCEETHSTHQKTVNGAGEACVREEEHSVCEAGDVKLGGEVIARVGKDPEC
jgi:hypothetical protein